MDKFKAAQMGELLIAAYAKKAALEKDIELHPDIKGFSILTDLYVTAGELIKNNEWFGFIVEGDDAIVVVIPGTTSFYDWENNADLALHHSAIGENCSVVEGVFELVLQIERIIYFELPALRGKNKQIHITGHSLGAAIAENIFLRNGQIFDGECYSFASPKSRTQKFEIDRLHRVYNRYDAVPRLPVNVPFIFELEHSGVEHELVWNLNDVIKNHAIENYVEILLS